MRMSMRRFTRLTNGFSKKLANHVAAIEIHMMHYNWCRPHTTLTQAHPSHYPTTPAMAAGLTDHVWVRRGSLRASESRPAVTLRMIQHPMLDSR